MGYLFPFEIEGLLIFSKIVFNAKKEWVNMCVWADLEKVTILQPTVV